MSITAIDDQGALSRETKDVTILNKKPEAEFTLGADIPSTWSFSEDQIGRIPFGFAEGVGAARDGIKVIQGKDSHSKVLQITGTNPHEPPFIKKYIGTQYYGSVEYYLMSTNTSQSHGYISLNSDYCTKYSFPMKLTKELLCQMGIILVF